MKKLLLLVHVVLLMQYSSYAQFGCLGNPSLDGPNDVCPGSYQTYTANASFSRFIYIEWGTNTGNAFTKINDKDILFYTQQYLVHRDLSASDLDLLLNFYPQKVKYRRYTFDNEQITFTYSQPGGFSQSVTASVLPDYRGNARIEKVELFIGVRANVNTVYFDLERDNLLGSTCYYHEGKSLNTLSTFDPTKVTITSTSTIPTCSSGGSFDIREKNITFSTYGYNFNWTLTDPLGTNKNSLISSNRNGNNVYISYLDRPGVWNLSCTLQSGCKIQTFSYPITVGNPFALTPAEIRIDGVNNYNYASLVPTCPKAYQTGYQMSVPMYNNIPDLQYTWTLPPGWRTYNASASSSATVSGYTQYTYKGQYLNSLTMDSYVKSNGNIPGGNGQLVIYACNVTSNPITISVVPNGPLDVRLNP
ncbi:MAG: hypothetical protein U0U66_14010 [Cytophagaceae bacterium]